MKVVPLRIVRRAAVNLNGISVAYVMGFFNALFGLLVVFGVKLTDSQIGSITALLNASLIMAVHFGHRVGEATASGRSAQVAVQELTETPLPPKDKGA